MRLWIFVTVILLIMVLASETFAKKTSSERTGARKLKAQRRTYETNNKIKDMQQSELKTDTVKENYFKNKKNILMEENTDQILGKHAKATLSDSDRKLKHKRSIQEKDIKKANEGKNKNSNIELKLKHSKDELKYVKSNKNRRTRDLKESEKNNMKNCQDSLLCSKSNQYFKQDKNKRKSINDEEVKNFKDNIVHNQKNKNSKEPENLNVVEREKKKAKHEGNTDKLTETDEQFEYSIDESKYKASKYKKDQNISCKNGKKSQKQSNKDEKKSKIVEEVTDDPLDETPLQKDGKVIGEEQNYSSNHEKKEEEGGEVEEEVEAEYDDTEENCLR